MSIRTPFFSIHCCLLDRKCDVARLHMNVGKSHVAVALWPSAKLQLYDRKSGRYTEQWGWIVVRPRPEGRG